MKEVTMKVALYPHQYNLPSGKVVINPALLFDPSTFGQIKCNSGCCQTSAEDHFMLPVLNGLYDFDLPDVIAHVSLNLSRAREIRTTYRIWIELTTAPHKYNKDGLPISVKNGKVQVQSLWRVPGWTSYPSEMLNPSELRDSSKSDFWTSFFLKNLQQSKVEALSNNFTHDKKVVQTYAVVPDC